MAIEVRPISEAEFRPWIEAVETAFGEGLTEEHYARLVRIFEVERVISAFDGERSLGGGAAFSFRFAVPGGELPGAGVTAVGVLPTHRRQGILRRVMARQLADVRAAGEPIAVLWASEGVIYQRFGYGLASLNAGFDLPREKAVFRQPAEWSGSVRLVGTAEARRALPAVYERVMRDSPGFFSRSADWWDVEVLDDPESRRRGASQKFFAVLERGGGVHGYAIYRVKHEWAADSRQELRVIEALGTDGAAERDVWRYLFGVDLIDRIISRMGPLDQPLLLQLANPEALGLRVSDGLWLRVVDVPGALAGRAYAADGELVLDVRDEFMPEVGGRWRMRVEDGHASLEPTAHQAELAVEINDLGSVYLGGFSFTDLGRAGRTVELVAGARSRADRLFATPRRPWCAQIF